MNVPNFLTILRIVLAVFIMPAALKPGIYFKVMTLMLFLAASLTDYLDGRLARKSGQITGFGILMDPIADKILVFSAFMTFVQMDLIPAWMVLAIIARDLLITGLRLSMPSGASQSARASGKHKTVVQFLAILGILIFLIVRERSGWLPEWDATARSVIYSAMIFVVGITLWSGFRYLVANRHAWDRRPQ